MLSEFLVSELFAWLLVFCRVGSALMVMPGFGENYIPTRVKLFLALLISMVVTPALTILPPVPSAIITLVSILSAEIMIGLFIGSIARLLISAIHVAGMSIASQSGLAMALVPDLAQNTGGQGSILGNLLSLTAVVLIFATNTHHLILLGLVDSYHTFTPGHFPIMEDVAYKASMVINESFVIAMKLASPHIVIGIVFYLGNGIIARLMPNIQIFFIMIPVQLMVGFFILLIMISSILMWYLSYFQEGITSLMTGV